MRSTRYVAYVIVFVATCTTAACTGLLGSYEVGAAPPGTGQEGGGSPTTEGGGPTVDGAVEDVFVPKDAPIDTPPVCTAPRIACGSVCVDLDGDKDNCGACGRSCLGGLCTAHVCQPFVLVNRTDVLDRTIVATDTDLFFGTTAAQLIQQPVTVGSSPITLATAAGNVYAIAPSPPRVYFTAVATGPNWQTWKATIGTGASGVTNNPLLGGTPVGAVVAGNNIHTLQIVAGTPESFQILACPLDGTACFGNGAGRPGSKLAAGNGFVFWTDQFGFVYAYPDAVGMRTAIASGEGTPNAPVWDGTTLFWVNGGTGKLRKSPYPSPTPGDFRDITSGANDVLVDAVNVYWSIFNGTDNDLLAAPKAGPATTAPVRITHGANIGTLAQTASGIYWSDGTAIRGIRKP
jgi:hypothetical protein